AVAEGAGYHVSFVFHLGSECCTRSDCKPTADDSVFAEITFLEVVYMHSSAFTLAVTGLSADNLCHNISRICPFFSSLSLAHLSTIDFITVIKQSAYDDGRCFLSHRQMRRSVYFSLCKKFIDFFIEKPDKPHLFVKFCQLL